MFAMLLTAVAMFSLAGCSGREKTVYALDKLSYYQSVTYKTCSQWRARDDEATGGRAHYDDDRRVLTIDAVSASDILDDDQTRCLSAADAYAAQSGCEVLSKQASTTDGVAHAQLVVANPAGGTDTVHIFTDGLQMYRLTVNGSDGIAEQTLGDIAASVKVRYMREDLLRIHPIVFEDGSVFELMAYWNERTGTAVFHADLYCAENNPLDNIETVFAALAYLHAIVDQNELTSFDLLIHGFSDDCNGFLSQYKENGEWVYEEHISDFPEFFYQAGQSINIYANIVSDKLDYICANIHASE
jgi:hypothetical protein